MQPVLFRTLLERMRLPIQITESRCECGSPLDKLGRHRGACPRSGRLRSRALPTERTMARVCREDRQMQLPTARHECRSPDHRPACHLVASGLPLHHAPIRALCSRLKFGTTLQHQLTRLKETYGPCEGRAEQHILHHNETEGNVE